MLVTARKIVCIGRAGWYFWRVLVYYIQKNKVRSSCEIEDLVESNLRKLCVIPRSRVVLLLHNSHIMDQSRSAGFTITRIQPFRKRAQPPFGRGVN